MPVPVERTCSMAVSNAKPRIPRHPEDADTHMADSKHRKIRKRKGKEVEEAGPSEGVSEVVEETPWAWKSLTDSYASRVPPVITKDGRYFFSVVGPYIKIYSIATGQVISTLDVSEGDDNALSGTSSNAHCVTSAILNPHNSFQLITGSQDGRIRIWDFLDAILLQTIDISRPILHIAAHEKIDDYLFVSVKQYSKKLKASAKDQKDDNVVVLRVSFKPTDATANTPLQRSSDVIRVGKTRTTTGLAISPSGKWLVATGGHKAYVCATSECTAGFTKFVSPQALTCLSFHPSEDYFATGDAVGCIRLWYCLNGSLSRNEGVERKAQTTTLHWHAHAVSSVAFTANGAYLLSGGEEAVLVIWQLHSGQKEYVPRVGAPIVHITLSRPADGDEEYLLSLADASYTFVHSSTLKISRSIARVKIDPAVSHTRPTSSSALPLAIHPTTRTLVLPSSHPSSLQIFSPSSSRLVSELEVSPSNKVSRQDDKPLEPSRVEHCLISHSGEWMVTVDRRESDEDFHEEIHMKIWRWDHKSESWTLNTRIDRPHGSRKVFALAFRPSTRPHDLVLITTGEDGNIKTWRIQSSRQKPGDTEEYWVARSTFRFRSEIPGCISWSADGSLFAVAMGPHVVIYDGQTFAFHQVLTCPDCRRVTSVQFIGSGSRYIAVTGFKDLMLWDLISRTILWHRSSVSNFERLVVHPTEESFAVFERVTHLPNQPSTRVYIHQPSSSVPVAIRILPFHFYSVQPDAPLKPITDQATFVFVGITQSWDVVAFGDDIRSPQDEGSTAREISQTSGIRKRTLFQDIFGKSAIVDSSSQSSSSSKSVDFTQSWKGKQIANIFDAPAYLMPPLGALFDPLLDTFLTLRPPRLVAQKSGEDTSNDDENLEGPGVSELVTVDAPIVRTVDKHEMDTFIELFKDHAIKASVSSQPAARPNDMHKFHGIPKTRTNGVSHTGSPHAGLAAPNGVKVATHQLLPPDEDSTPGESPRAGKKRKKSLG